MTHDTDDPVARILTSVTDPLRMAPGQIEKLRELASSADEADVRVRAIYALSQLAKPSEHRVLETVIDALHSSVNEVRVAAARTLVGWGNRAVPAMLEAIRASADDVPHRSRLIILLGRIGPAAGAARPYLTHLLKDPEVGALAAETLPKLQVGLVELMPWLARHLLDWCLVGSALTVALILIMEFARPFMVDWMPLGKGGNRVRIARAVVLCGLGGCLAIVQVGRALLRYEVPHRKRWLEDAPVTLVLPALLVLVGLVAFLIYRLESLPGL